MFKLIDYASRGTPVNNRRYPRCSVYHGLPIDKLEVTKILLANMFPESKFRIRYRGKRAEHRDGRTRTQKSQDCLKKYATSFAVYFA